MPNDAENRLTIRTPEGITFTTVLAGPVVRFLAWLIDAGVVGVLAYLTSAIAGALGVFLEDVGAAFSIASLFAISFGYAITFEWFWRGQTLGKRMMRLRVADELGLELRFDQIVVRNLLRIVDRLPVFYLVGGIACLATRHNQRLGDMAANTVVIRTPPIVEPSVDDITGGKFNSFRGYPHLEARLRQNLSAEEAAIALEALVRRDEFEPGARVVLFRDLAEHFRGAASFPDDATLGLTDEQYVRNVVDSVYASREPASRRQSA